MDDKTIHMLSTIDNPYNPFTHFDLWNQYDEARGYFTNEYFARVVNYDGCFSERQKHIARENAIQQIIDADPLHIYIKVTADEKVKPIAIFSEAT